MNYNYFYGFIVVFILIAILRRMIRARRTREAQRKMMRYLGGYPSVMRKEL